MRRMITGTQAEQIESNSEKLKSVLVSKATLGKFELDPKLIDHEENYYIEDGFAIYEGYLYFYSPELYEQGWYGEAEDEAPLITIEGYIDIPEEYGETWEDFKEYIASHPVETTILYGVDEYFITNPAGEWEWNIDVDSIEINPENPNEITVPLGQDKFVLDESVKFVASQAEMEQLKVSNQMSTNKLTGSGSNSILSGFNNINAQNLNTNNLKVKDGSWDYLYFGSISKTPKALDITTEGDEQEFSLIASKLQLGNRFIFQTLHYPQMKYQFRLKGTTLYNAPVFAIAHSNDETNIHISFTAHHDSQKDWIDVVVDATSYTGYYHTIMIDVVSATGWDLVDYNN